MAKKCSRHLEKHITINNNWHISAPFKAPLVGKKSTYVARYL